MSDNTMTTKGDGRDCHLKHSLAGSMLELALVGSSEISYRSANKLAGKYGSQQTIRQWRRMLDAIVIYRILYANSFSATRLAQL